MFSKFSGFPVLWFVVSSQFIARYKINNLSMVVFCALGGSLRHCSVSVLFEITTIKDSLIKESLSLLVGVGLVRVFNPVALLDSYTLTKKGTKLYIRLMADFCSLADF